MEIKDLKPQDVFYWFEQLEQFPRESGNEKAVSDFLVKFAKERNLDVYQDDTYNVIIKKDATKGYENSPIVAIQGHMDMVCVKEEDSDHDFTKDPIELVVDGDYLKANKTSLGADDGIAVAYGLAVLDSNEIEHGPLELVITTQEETSMGGVSALDTSKITAKYLLNIDSEEEGEFTVGCAGGLEVRSTFKKEFESPNGEFVEIKISGLTGGHSGMEIDKYRKNGIKEIARIIYNLEDYRIASIHGGSKKNAIATNGYAIVEVKDSEKALEKLEEIKEIVMHEAKATDPDIKIEINKTKFDKDVLTKELSKNIVEFLYTIPYGLFNKDLELNTLTSSANIGILEEDDEKIEANAFVRSSIESEKQNYAHQIGTVALSHGAQISYENGYPGWEKEESSLIGLCQDTYKEITGKDSIVTTTHGGLECGFLKTALKDTEMISFGPNLSDVHTTREKVEIKSVERIYEFLIELLKKLK